MVHLTRINQMFGTGISDAAHKLSGARDFAVVTFSQFREAKIHQHRPLTVVGEHHVVRLDIAMDHTLVMQRLNGCSNVAEVAPPIFRHRIIPNFAAQSEGLDPDAITSRILEAVEQH